MQMANSERTHTHKSGPMCSCGGRFIWVSVMCNVMFVCDVWCVMYACGMCACRMNHMVRACDACVVRHDMRDASVGTEAPSITLHSKVWCVYCVWSLWSVTLCWCRRLTAPISLFFLLLTEHFLQHNIQTKGEHFMATANTVISHGCGLARVANMACVIACAVLCHCMCCLVCVCRLPRRRTTIGATPHMVKLRPIISQPIISQPIISQPIISHVS